MTEKTNSKHHGMVDYLSSRPTVVINMYDDPTSWPVYINNDVGDRFTLKVFQIL